MPPPKSPWTKQAPHNFKNNDGFPSIDDKELAKAAEPAKLAPTKPSRQSLDYSETQHDEVEALRSIYMEDYEEVELKGAWSKSAGHAFKLHLKSYTDPDSSVIVSITMTATYPKTAPILVVSDAENLRDQTRREISSIVDAKPKALLGSEMIYEIATLIQDALEDEVQHRAGDAHMPSLEEERAVQEAAAMELAREQADAERRKEAEASLEQDRMLGHMLQEELERRKERAREVKRRSRPVPLDDKNLVEVVQDSTEFISFEQLITLRGEYVHPVSFRSVAGMVPMRKGPMTEVLMVRPILSQGGRSVPSLVLKQAELKDAMSQSGDLKREIQDLEGELETLKKLRHSNIVDFLDFKVNHFVADSGERSGVWNINILTEYANKGSLLETLDTVSSLGVEIVRGYTIQLLEALDFYHCNGIIHKSIHAGNVLLWRPQSGTTIVKLGDGGYQQHLYQLTNHVRATATFSTGKSAYWLPPEVTQGYKGQFTRKTDVWDLGVVVLQMMFGLSIFQRYKSPNMLMDTVNLSESSAEFLRKMFRPDARKRPTAFDLLPSEFLRNDAPVLAQLPSPHESRLSSSASLIPSRHLQPRSDSMTAGGALSRYASDFVEAGRLGRGGFGEVVKSRNKLDGRFYAIKKITQNSTSSLTDVLSEIMLLSRLNHPYVVRYFTAWMEEDLAGSTDTEEETTSTMEDSSLSPHTRPSIEFGHSTGGLDFISSSGYPKIQFGYDSDEESSNPPSDDEECSEDLAVDGPSKIDGNALSLKRTRSGSRTSRSFKTTLYIQMEYCEKHTLRDLLRQGLFDNVDETWRLFRQIIQGLNHIHGLGIIHRDLKPDNIFIDVSSNPRIGDFGLATSGQYFLADKASSSGNVDGDLTRSIGTALYVAPELKSSFSGHYNDKVDMYSLGIIFFEMCFPLKTAMERDRVLREIREKDHDLPEIFQSSIMAVQGEVINSLISHRPSERPSSAELLHSGKLPVQIEDETMRQALHGLSDSKSPYHQQILSALFTQPIKQVKDYAWDMGSTNDYGTNDLLLQSTVKEKLTAIFRRHGAVEAQRPLLFPRSSHYSANVVQLLDSSGTLVQLPYDLTLPHARAIAKQIPRSSKSFAFGNVYRDLYTGGQPRSHGEVDFDIVSADTLDLALKEAEVIKVLDEIVDCFPSLDSAQMCIHLNHSDILKLIMDFCRISEPQRPAVIEALSKLNIGQWTWQKIRNELRMPSLGVSVTSLEDLERFNFRESPEKAFVKLKSILGGSEFLERTTSIFAHINAVLTYLKRFKIHQKIFCSPLSSFNDKFYQGGLLFQCLYDTKKKDVFAAGGRYDQLIQDHRPRMPEHPGDCHAVGFNLGWEKLVVSMSRLQKQAAKAFLRLAEEELRGHWAPKRCDVLVASLDPGVLRFAGTSLVQDLWAKDISAELAVDANSTDELMSYYRDDKHSWIIIMRQESGNAGERSLKVKSTVRKEDTEVRQSELMSWLRSEIRERDQREGTYERAKSDRTKLSRQTSNQDTNPAGGDRDNHVRVLISNHRGKKTSRLQIVETAQSRTRELVQTFLDGPIAAIETRDEILDAIRDTRLSEPDSWKEIIQRAPLSERKYLSQVHELLLKMANEVEGTTRNAFIYNFRTGACIYYDLGRST
ncbi:MAG: hypothetical protein M1827_000516 [Pycnora praestabilis]|nr:MAG: hypothetical protein M1827_000516 [Pycnora praestabilis]